MSVPEVVPILHEPGYRTDTIGRCRGGQFFASVCYARPEESFDVDDGAWYAVLHRFDEGGRHLGSRIEAAPEECDAGAPKAAEELLREWLDALPEREFGDIAVAPFAVLVDGCRFGLVVERHGEDATEDDWAELYPDGLGFHAPWDGEYDT
ncbi:MULTISPECIES: hypothetical protein [Kitasatospora]|uniref:hypothetical protein n=1 Tax=Kitasatospora TaxID=2063 RepID=UPI0004BEEFA2|nr:MULTISPECIES: hypothetical protein [Kitasatospora]